MALNLAKRRKTQEDDDIPMAPMIDCVFLLLIFFMVSAVMKVPPPFTVLPYPILQRSTNSRERNSTFSLTVTDVFQLNDQEMLTLEDMELFHRRRMKIRSLP